MKVFQGKTAVITGAASGLGLECALLAAARGMRLVLVDVQASALEQVCAQFKAQGAQVWSHSLDVSNAEQMALMAQDVQQHLGPPHLVLNNAGVGGSGLIWECSEQDWQWVLGVNLFGVIHGVRLFTPMMLQAARADPTWQGHIVNTASMAGLLTPPNMGVYNVSKHAVVALTETLYQDLQLVTEQITASVLCPYFVPTSIADSERHRPAMSTAPTPSQQVGQAMMEKAVLSGKVSAVAVAQKVFEAIEQQSFYIFSHPHALNNLALRMQAILLGNNPPDPFAQRPELGERLRQALKTPS